MKTNKLLEKVHALLDSDKRKKEEQHEQLAELLAKLKKREGKLEGQIAKADDDEHREELEQELAVVRKQYRKGQKALESRDD